MSRVLPCNAKQWEIPLLLDGRRTVIRRVMNPKPTGTVVHRTGYDIDEWGEMKETALGGEYFSRFKLPYHPGDILYVRETWCKNPNYEEYYYAAKRRKGASAPYGLKWRPSIHMPKEAARIWLKATNVRVEQIKDMTLDDFLCEGITLRPEAYNDPENAYQQAKRAFAELIKDCTEDSWMWVVEFERFEKPENV